MPMLFESTVIKLDKLCFEEVLENAKISHWVYDLPTTTPFGVQGCAVINPMII